MFISNYCFGVQGTSPFIRAVADSQVEGLESFFDDVRWQYTSDYFKNIPALQQDNRVMALGGAEIFGVITAFIGSCFAKKIFDEVYDRILKRPISKQLDVFFSKIDVPVGKFVEYRDVVYLEDIDLVVMICLVVEEGNTKNLQAQLMQAHSIAYSFIEHSGRKARIHCHRISQGVIALEPEFFNQIEDIGAGNKSQKLIHVRAPKNIEIQ